MEKPDIHACAHCFDEIACAALKYTDYHTGDEFFGTFASHDRNNPYELTLCDIAGEFLYCAKRLHDRLASYNSSLASSHFLKKYPGGLYGFRDEYGTELYLFNGSVIDAKITDSEGNSCWIPASIGRNGDDYCLCGFPDIPLEGLEIRNRKQV